MTEVKAIVRHPFIDKYTEEYHSVGEIIQLSQERAEEIMKHPQGFIQILEAPKKKRGKAK